MRPIPHFVTFLLKQNGEGEILGNLKVAGDHRARLSRYYLGTTTDNESLMMIQLSPTQCFGLQLSPFLAIDHSGWGSRVLGSKISGGHQVGEGDEG